MADSVDINRMEADSRADILLAIVKEISTTLGGQLEVYIQGLRNEIYYLNRERDTNDK